MSLFTEKEMETWAAKKKEAQQDQPSDEIFHRDSPHPYNKSAWNRLQMIDNAWRVERLRRIRSRPDDVLNFLVVAFHERGSQPITWEDTFGKGFGDRLTQADTPQVRRHLHDVLEGLRVVPRSWATSATTRFFRGIGKQGEKPWSEKPGAGVLSKEHGWKTFEADWFVGLFYNSLMAGVFFTDDSIDPYGEEGREVLEEGGNRFAVTSNIRDDAFFDDLINRLAARGLAVDIVKPEVVPPKPRKVKVFQTGDVITEKNLRDLPTNSHLQWTVVQYPGGYRGQQPEIFEAEERTYELVVLERETGILKTRPVMSGKAFSPQEIVSSSLYKKRYDKNEVTATYLGPWTGETLDVEVARWTPKTRKVTRRRVGAFPDETYEET